MAQQQLLERKKGPYPFFGAVPWKKGYGPFCRKSQRAGAQAADRPRRNLENEHAFVVDAALGMDRTVVKTEGRCRSGDSAHDGALNVFGCCRWGEVNRFLEERPIKRIRLVENRE